MKQKNRYVFDMLDMDSPDASRDVVFRAGKPVSGRADGNLVVLSVPFYAQELRNMFLFPAKGAEPKLSDVIVRAYGDSIVRVTVPFGGKLPDDAANPMLEWDPSLSVERLEAGKTADGWAIIDGAGRTR